MFLPVDNAYVPSTAPKQLLSRQATSQISSSSERTTSEIAAIILGTILGIIALVALVYLARFMMKSVTMKIELAVFERVKEEVRPTPEHQTVVLKTENPPRSYFLRQRPFTDHGTPSPPLETQVNRRRFPPHRALLTQQLNRTRGVPSLSPKRESDQRPGLSCRDPWPLRMDFGGGVPSSSSSDAIGRQQKRDPRASVDALSMRSQLQANDPLANSLLPPWGLRRSRMDWPPSAERGEHQRRRDVRAVVDVLRRPARPQPSPPSRPVSPNLCRGVRYVAPYVTSGSFSSQGSQWDDTRQV